MLFSGKGAEVSVEVGRCALAWRRSRFHIQKGCFCYLQSRSEVSELFSANKIVNLVLNSAKSFKVASRQKSTNFHTCSFLSGVIDGTLGLKEFWRRVDILFWINPSQFEVPWEIRWLIPLFLCLIVFGAASYYRVGYFRYINILTWLQGLGK